MSAPVLAQLDPATWDVLELAALHAGLTLPELLARLGLEVVTCVTVGVTPSVTGEHLPSRSDDSVSAGASDAAVPGV